jgi:hypothetical protein
MWILARVCAAALIFAGIAPIDAQACTIKEIVQMASRGAGKSAILEKCDRQVSGAPRCTAREVVDLALEEMDEYDIRDRCKRCAIPMCITDAGECRITAAIDRIREGGPCSCPTPWGWVRGEAECQD